MRHLAPLHPKAVRLSTSFSSSSSNGPPTFTLESILWNNQPRPISISDTFNIPTLCELSVTDCLCFKPSPVVLAGFHLHQNRTDPNICFDHLCHSPSSYNCNCCPVSQAQASRMSRFCAATGSAIAMCEASVGRRRGWAERFQVPIADAMLFGGRPILRTHARLTRWNQVLDE